MKTDSVSRSTQSTRHTSPTVLQPLSDKNFDPKDTARLHIPAKNSLSSRLFEVLQESSLPSISEELGDEDYALSYISSATGYLKRELLQKTETLNELEDTLDQKTSDLAEQELELDTRLDSLEQCQRVYAASTELAKDQLLRSRALLQSISKTDSQALSKINTLKTSNRVLTKAQTQLTLHSDNFEAFYKQFQEEKTAFLSELSQFKEEKEQVLRANAEMQRNQDHVDQQLQLITSRLQEISKIRSDFNAKCSSKKRTLQEKEALLSKREQELRSKHQEMERMWTQYEIERKGREETLKLKEQELLRKIAQCDELLALKEELDREKAAVKQRESHTIAQLQEKDAELEAKEKRLELLSQDLDLQREILASESTAINKAFKSNMTAEELREQMEMRVEDVMSAGLRLEQLENWLVSREETLQEIDANMNKERMEIDSAARLLETLHRDLEAEKTELAGKKDRVNKDQQMLEREKSKVETICKELERQQTELEAKETALQAAERRLKERERNVEAAENALRSRDQLLHSTEAADSGTVEYSQLDQELRCKRQELRQDKDRITRAKQDLQSSKLTETRSKWLETDGSRAELRRINQMLQESYMTPRGAMTPLSSEVSPVFDDRKDSD